MTFHRLTPSRGDGDLHENIPWGNNWLKVNKDGNTPFPICYVLEYDSGLMVVCLHYKAYLHKGRQDHDDLLEAVEVFRESKTPELMLYCELDKKGRPIILRKDDEECLYWHKTENRFVQVFNRSLPPQEAESRGNPLLAGRTAQGNARSTQRKGEASRSPKAS